MKIRMLTKVISGSQVYFPGEVIDISGDKAQEFIRKGFATFDLQEMPQEMPKVDSPRKNTSLTSKKTKKVWPFDDNEST